jgi:hypothetical protein
VPWKLTVRAGPKVQRLRLNGLDDALDALEARARELAGGSHRRPVDVKYKRFEPIQQVAARIEIAGPQRLMPSVRAGVDIRGDGSTEAFLGRVRRRVIEQRKNESPYAALRRALHAR